MSNYETDICENCEGEFLSRAVDGGYCYECAEEDVRCENCDAVFARADGEKIAGLWLCPACAKKIGDEVAHVAAVCR